MTFADKSRHDRTFQQVTHKGGESEINYIKWFQNAHALSVSVGNSYSEDQLMHTFLDNFHQGEKYSAQIASHQAELRREEKFTDQKSLNISSLQTDYLNLDSSSGSSRNSERAYAVHPSAHFMEVIFTLQKNVSKGEEGKRKTLAQVMFWRIDERNVCLRNSLDVELNIT